MNEAIAQDVADFNGWKSYPVDRGLDGYLYVVKQALDREWHRTGCDAYLEYLESNVVRRAVPHGTYPGQVP